MDGFLLSLFSAGWHLWRPAEKAGVAGFHYDVICVYYSTMPKPLQFLPKGKRIDIARTNRRWREKEERRSLHEGEAGKEEAEKC
jgi:hypothetical protein